MRTPTLARRFGAIAIVAAALAHPAGRALHAQPIAPSPRADYVSGGTGLEDRERLAAALPGYNLKVVTAGAQGEYLADAHVRVFDAAGKAVLDATLDGPWLLARLPPGSYRVTAEIGGEQRRTHTVRVPAAGARELVLRWSPH
jgi:hypothetical protein